MPFFEYQAIDSRKKTKIKQTIEAKNKEDAFHMISDMGLVLTSLVQIKSETDQGFSLMNFLNKIKTKDVVIFSRQFAVMLRASVPVVKSLRILTKQTENPTFKNVIARVAEDVDGGMKLSQALAEHPKAFGDFFIAMIKSGETSGRLDEVLDYLAEQQEKDYDLMSKIKGAMIYPVFIVSALVVVGIVMMIVVIPKLTAILKESGTELPTSTKILIGTSDFFVHFWWLLLIIVVVIFVVIKYLTSTDSGKRYKDWLSIKIPIFGRLFQRIFLVRFSRSLATLSNGGIPLIESLNITSEVVGNKVYRDIIKQTIAEVQEGNTIASVLLTSKEIPAMVSYMVAVGEQTGNLDVVLDKLSDFYTREIDNMVTNLVSLIEPLIMVVLGVAVGLMVAAIMLPMYNLASSF